MKCLFKPDARSVSQPARHRGPATNLRALALATLILVLDYIAFFANGASMKATFAAQEIV